MLTAPLSSVLVSHAIHWRPTMGRSLRALEAWSALDAAAGPAPAHATLTAPSPAHFDAECDEEFGGFLDDDGALEEYLAARRERDVAHQDAAACGLLAETAAWAGQVAL